jgi:lipopolysaccharide/colanic/teichoic acid biosynthesis glycosyltransferase
MQGHSPHAREFEIGATGQTRRRRLAPVGGWDIAQRRKGATLDAGTMVSGADPSDEPDPELRQCDSVQFDLSPWSQSRAKRILDVTAILVCSPILVPLLVLVALAVFATSGMPVIFRQERIGRDSVPFVFYKFRTMRPSSMNSGSGIATESVHRITWLGSLLRRSKLDELPQILHVLTGDMSLVGPRPKVPEQQLKPLPCRPGLTGKATLAFAREESILMQVPQDALATFFHDTILPAKHRLDAQYMRDATLRSDLRILVDTILCRWGSYSRAVQWTHGQEEREDPLSQIASIFP